MGDYVFHVGRGELKRGDESVKLTERQRDLLRLFAHRPRLPIARHELASLAAAFVVTRTAPLPRYIRHACDTQRAPACCALIRHPSESLTGQGHP